MVESREFTNAVIAAQRQGVFQKRSPQTLILHRMSAALLRRRATDQRSLAAAVPSLRLVSRCVTMIDR